MSNGLAHNNPRIIIDIIRIIAVLVVIDIIRHARRSAKHFVFCLRLDAFGAACDSAGCDAGFEEGTVVGAAVKFDFGVVGSGDGVEVVAIEIRLMV